MAAKFRPGAVLYFKSLPTVRRNFDPEDERSKILRNVGILRNHYTTSQHSNQTTIFFQLSLLYPFFVSFFETQ